MKFNMSPITAGDSADAVDAAAAAAAAAVEEADVTMLCDIDGNPIKTD